MSSDNIEKFNEITSKVFALLYSTFPMPQNLYPSSIGITETPALEHDGESGTLGGIGWLKEREPSDEEKCFGHTIAWLVKAGYVTAERRIDISSHEDVVLTIKGLEVLKAVPSVLDKDGLKP
ncbi:hypothetical protein ACI2KR_29220 [Pseudomonas luteola]